MENAKNWKNEKPPTPLCPHCKNPLTGVGWLCNAEAGLFTFYHDDPACMVALNIQMVPVEQKIERPLLSELSRWN
jgi:hypothetical protein